MAHFAKLGTGDIVTAVHVVHNNELLDENGVEQEAKGVAFLNKLYKTNDTWKQTSYNTRAGVHVLGGTPLRKNYAGVGYRYHRTLDAFIPPRPFPSCVLNKDTGHWDYHKPYPDDGTTEKRYKWHEFSLSWVEHPETK